MRSRLGFYALILVVGLLSTAGLGLLDQGGKRLASQQRTAVAAPLAANGGNSGGNFGGNFGGNSGTNSGGNNGGNGGSTNNNGNGNGNQSGNNNNGNKNGNGNGNQSSKGNGNGNGNKSSNTSQPAPAAPAAPVGQTSGSAGPCTFILGFAYLHSLLGGRDGVCVDNEHDDPNGTGDRVQGTRKPDGTFGYMVWQRLTNTMRWTDGFRTVTYSKCGLQERLNTQTFAWEQNPSLMQQPGETPPLGACNLG